MQEEGDQLYGPNHAVEKVLKVFFYESAQSHGEGIWKYDFPVTFKCDCGEKKGEFFSIIEEMKKKNKNVIDKDHRIHIGGCPMCIRSEMYVYGLSMEPYAGKF